MRRLSSLHIPQLHYDLAISTAVRQEGNDGREIGQHHQIDQHHQQRGHDLSRHLVNGNASDGRYDEEVKPRAA